MPRLYHPAGLSMFYVLVQRARGCSYDWLVKIVGRRDESRLCGPVVGQHQHPAAAKQLHRLGVVDKPIPHLDAGWQGASPETVQLTRTGQD